MSTIDVRGVSKRYTKYDDTPALVTRALRLARRSRHSELWAVRDLDLTVEPGECVGLIGRNGSGKSTTLQMLCGVTAPTSGRLHVRGRIAPLISVGVGFHPELTGRENVFINGAILGLSRREITRRYDSIVDFADIGSFMDTPTKFYSSGMTVRLGFAVAAHASAQVLLVDEVLAVGDLGFQLKCFEHMTSLRDQGTTIVVVSHNLGAIQRLCPRTVVLSQGRQIFDGPTVDALSAYHEALAAADQPAAHGELAHEAGVLDVLAVELLGRDGRRTAHVEAGEQLRVVVTAESSVGVDRPFLSLVLSSADGVTIYVDSNVLDPFPPLPAGGRATWQVEVDARLPTGNYALSVSVARATQGDASSQQEVLRDLAVLSSPTTRSFFVTGRGMAQGLADLQARFAAGPTTRGSV